LENAISGHTFGLTRESAQEAAWQALSKTPDVCTGSEKMFFDAVNADSQREVDAHNSSKTDNRQACFA
jgi:hypothetical protein